MDFLNCLFKNKKTKPKQKKHKRKIKQTDFLHANVTLMDYIWEVKGIHFALSRVT